MFTLEESALLRRMLHVLMWSVATLVVAGGLWLIRSWPWLAHLWLAARTLARR